MNLKPESNRSPGSRELPPHDLPLPPATTGRAPEMGVTLDLRGFEVNTDASLVDPDWEAFADDHDRRFGLAIRHLKSMVRGRNLDNAAMKLRVGKAGFYAQSRRFPAAFYGDTATAEVREVDLDEAQSAVWEAVALYRSAEAQSLTCVYSDDDPPDVFFGYRQQRPRGEVERFELGMVRASLPLHLRVMVRASTPNELLAAERGVLIYQRTPEGRHMLLRASGRRQPFAVLGDLAD